MAGLYPFTIPNDGDHVRITLLSGAVIVGIWCYQNMPDGYYIMGWDTKHNQPASWMGYLSRVKNIEVLKPVVTLRTNADYQRVFGQG